MDCLENLIKSSQSDSKSPEPSGWNGNGGLSNRIENLQKTGFLSDLTLFVGKEEFKVHRLILRIASPVFHQIFKKHPRLDKMEIPDFDSSAFKIFLNYLYSCSGSNLININNARLLLAIGSKFQVEDLIGICTNILKEQLNNKNACKFFQLGMDHGIKDLMQSSLSYISKNAWQIINEKAFEELNMDCVFEIAQRDDLQVVSEIQLFNGIVSWVEAECERKEIEPYGLTPSGETNFRNEIKKLLPLIRFPLMDEKEFIKTVMTKEILSLEEVVGIMCLQRIPMEERACLHGIRGAGKYNSKARNYYKQAKVGHDNRCTEDNPRASSSTSNELVMQRLRSNILRLHHNYLSINANHLSQGVQSPKFENFKLIGNIGISGNKAYSRDEEAPNIPWLIASSQMSRFQHCSLAVGFKKAVQIYDYDKYNEMKMRFLLTWLTETNYFKKVQENVHKKPDFISFGSQITDAMITPLQTRMRGWEIYAARFNDTVFIWRQARPQKWTRDIKSHYTLAYQALLTGKNLRTQRLNQYEKSFVIQEATFGPHQLLLVNEVDGQGDEGEFVKIQPYIECATDGMKGKALNYWGKCVVSGVKKLVLGERDDNGFLQENHVLSLKEATTKVGWTSSDFNKCYQFENTLLTWIKSHFKENNPNFVKKFSWSGPQQIDEVKCVKVDEKDLPIGGMIPDWFIQQVL